MISPPASSSARPLIALISATPAAIPPARKAFSDNYPDAELLNILDDGLQEQANRAGGLTPHLTERMKRLINHAVFEDADGVLLTCSMYSSVAQLVAGDLAVPILGPDDAAFAIATAGDYRSILVLASLPAGPGRCPGPADRGRRPARHCVADPRRRRRGSVRRGPGRRPRCIVGRPLRHCHRERRGGGGRHPARPVLLDPGCRSAAGPTRDPSAQRPNPRPQTLRDAITGEAAGA